MTTERRHTLFALGLAAAGAAMLMIGGLATARAQQQPIPEHNIRLNDAEINTIKAWGFEKPFKESADLLSKIFQQLQVEQMQRDAAAQKANADAVDKAVQDKLNAEKKPEPAK